MLAMGKEDARVERIKEALRGRLAPTFTLRACPFCGGEARPVLVIGRVLTLVCHIECTVCNACTATYADEEEGAMDSAEDAWNDRTVTC